MSADWPLVKLGELVNEITVGFVGSMTHEYVDKGIPFFRSKNISEYEIEWNDIRYISPAFHRRLKKSVLRPGDVAIVRTGKPGTACVIPDSVDEANCSDVVIVRVNNEKLSAHYLCYFMNSIASHQVSSYLVGAVQQHFNVASAKMIKIPLPTRGEQEKIVKILKALDDKRKINYQINQTLETMSQAIFKSWFVDFEPVKAKIAAIEAGEDAESVNRAAMRAISGKSDDELDKMQAEQPDEYAQLEGTAELFPAAMVESEIGLIPEGWGVKKIGDYLNTISKTYPLKTVSEVIFLNTGDIQNGKVLHSNKSTVETLPGQAKKSIQKDDILYSEIRPENKRFAYVFFDGKEHVVSTKLMVLRPIADIDSKFLYFILTQQDIIDFLQMMAESRSGTFPQITFNVISKVEFFGPKDNKIIHIFSKSILEPFMQERYLKDEENTQLSNIRDTLLPKLLSGELSVNTIELAEEK